MAFASLSEWNTDLDEPEPCSEVRDGDGRNVWVADVDPARSGDDRGAVDDGARDADEKEAARGRSPACSMASMRQLRRSNRCEPRAYCTRPRRRRRPATAQQTVGTKLSACRRDHRLGCACCCSASTAKCRHMKFDRVDKRARLAGRHRPRRRDAGLARATWRTRVEPVGLGVWRSGASQTLQTCVWTPHVDRPAWICPSMAKRYARLHKAYTAPVCLVAGRTRRLPVSSSALRVNTLILSSSASRRHRCDRPRGFGRVARARGLAQMLRPRSQRTNRARMLTHDPRQSDIIYFESGLSRRDC